MAHNFYRLVHPEPDYYSYFCQRVHGLCKDDTDNAPLFPDVWKQLEEEIARQFFPTAEINDSTDLASRIPFVAHNARFDEQCLKSAFQVFRIDYPDYTFFDTLKASRRHFGTRLPNHQLHTVAAACGYSLEHHHHALCDAEACAAIALKLL